MTIEAGLVAELSGNAAVAAIVKKRIHPLVIPQGGTLPAVVYQRISSVRNVDLGGPSSFVQVRMQIDCWHTSFSGAILLADAVRGALNGVGIASPKTLGSEPVQLVYLENDQALQDIEGDKAEYRISQDWIIIHLEI